MSTIDYEFIQYLVKTSLLEAFDNDQDYVSILDDPDDNSNPFTRWCTDDIIENFGAGIANTDNTEVTNINKQLVESNNKITKDMVVKGMSALVKSAATSAMNSNSAEVSKMISAVNKLNIKGATSKGDFVLSNINQDAKIESKTTANMVQKIQTKVMNDLSSKLDDNISKQSEDIKDVAKATNMGDSIGGVMKSLADMGGKAIDGAVDLGKTFVKAATPCIACTTNDKKTNENSSSIKNSLNLSDKFAVDKDEKINSTLSNTLDQKNIAKCAEAIQAGGEINLENIASTDGSIKITNIQQEAIIGSVTDCVFNQSLLTEVANKMIDSINKTISNASKTMAKERQGDLYAAGAAAAAVIASAGTAVGAAAEGVGKGVGSAAEGVGKGVGAAGEGVGKGLESAGKGLESAGKGVGAAAEGAGKGVGSAAEGVGKGVSSAMSGMLMPFIIIGIIAIVAIFVLPKLMAGGQQQPMMGPPPMYGPPPMGGPPPMMGPPPMTGGFNIRW